MRGLRISNKIGIVLIAISTLLILSTLSEFSDSMERSYSEQQPVVILPSGVQYTIRDPFREKEEFSQTIQSIGNLIVGTALGVSGVVVYLSTKKQIKRLKNVT